MQELQHVKITSIFCCLFEWKTCFVFRPIFLFAVLFIFSPYAKLVISGGKNVNLNTVLCAFIQKWFVFTIVLKNQTKIMLFGLIQSVNAHCKQTGTFGHFHRRYISNFRKCELDAARDISKSIGSILILFFAFKR